MKIFLISKNVLPTLLDIAVLTFKKLVFSWYETHFLYG